MTERIQDSSPSAAALDRIASGQERLIELIEAQAGQGDGIDAESRMRLRSIDVQMLRLLEELSAGRQESIAAIRMDINKLVEVLRPRRPRPLGGINPEDR
jgi:hypothetical protein